MLAATATPVRSDRDGHIVTRTWSNQLPRLAFSVHSTSVIARSRNGAASGLCDRLGVILAVVIALAVAARSIVLVEMVDPRGRACSHDTHVHRFPRHLLSSEGNGTGYKLTDFSDQPYRDGRHDPASGGDPTLPDRGRDATVVVRGWRHTSGSRRHRSVSVPTGRCAVRSCHHDREACRAVRW